MGGKVLITGATGFIGSNVVSAFLDRGLDVHILIRPTSNVEAIEHLIEALTVHVHDGTLESLKDILALVKPSHVFHLASLFLSQHSDDNLQELLDSNIGFSTNLVEAMTSCEHPPYLINTGTSWQHYRNYDYNPVNLYAATKQAFESTLKLFDTYGPNDPRKKLISLLHDTATSGNLLLMSPGDQIIDLVYIDDVVSAFHCAYDYVSQQPSEHSRFAIHANKRYSLKNLVVAFEKTLKIKLNIDWGSREYRAREVMTPWLKFSSVPGWKATISLEEGLLRTYKQTPSVSKVTTKKDIDNEE
jgi:nucleoside-diphosphate-sugar epimerase